MAESGLDTKASAKKKKKKRKSDEILAHDPRLSPRSIQVHGLGLWVGISTLRYPAQYLPQNRSV